MRRFLTGTVAVLFFIQCPAQDDILRAALYLSGAQSEEEIDQDWIQRLEGMNRVRINSGRLRPGLLTDYQIATLENVGTKAKVTGENWRVGGAWRTGDWTAHAEADTRLGRLLLGDFNIRYGEGLSQWSGFSMESLSTVDAFIRRSTGISPVWSYTSSSVHRGVAYENGGRHWRTSAWGTLAKVFSLEGRINLRGIDATAEVAYRGKSAGGKASARWKVGENGKLATQVRVIPSRFSGKKNGEYALAAGYQLQSGRWQSLAGKTGFGSSVPAWKLSLTVDAALLPLVGVDPRRVQVRSYLTGNLQIASAWSLDVQFTERFRNYENPRTDLRLDTKFASGPWLSVLRLEAVRCDAWGFLTYLEGGYKDENLSAYFRFNAFHIPQWEDRIYCYERDAPGTFSVPAYSGTGLAASLTAGYKFRLWRITLKANLRAGYMLRVGRESTPTMNFQLQCTY